MKLLYASAFGLVAANQIVRFDDPKFLLTGIFDDNHLDAQQIFDQFMNGRWCHTLDDFSYPLESDDWTYLSDKPVEKWCKMWRLCRIETKRRELSCNQVNYRNMATRAANQQSGNFFASTATLAYAADREEEGHMNGHDKILAGYYCETEFNETPCLQKTCSCDLQLADKVLKYVLEYYGAEREAMMAVQGMAALGHEASAVEAAVHDSAEAFVNSEVPAIEASVSDEAKTFDEKVVEIVEDHAVLVAEHTQLVEDIAHFKEKVQDVVKEHTETNLEGLAQSLSPVDHSLETEEAVFAVASEKTDEVIGDLIAAEHAEGISELETVEAPVGELLEMNDLALGQIAEVGDIIEDISGEVSETEAVNTIEDIAAFNQDFVFEDSISIKK